MKLTPEQIAAAAGLSAGEIAKCEQEMYDDSILPPSQVALMPADFREIVNQVYQP